MAGLSQRFVNRLRRELSINIIASGGISSVREIETLNAMGVAGAILGKAVYDGRLDLGMCLDAAGNRRAEEDDEPALF